MENYWQYKYMLSKICNLVTSVYIIQYILTDYQC